MKSCFSSACGCDGTGSSSLQCADSTGQCTCNDGYKGTNCDATCGCDTTGSSSTSCDQSTGQCTCKTGYAGRICTACDQRMAWNNSTPVTNCNEGHFVLIISGYPYSNGRKTEVLDLKNYKFTCPGLPDYPIKMAYGVGGMIGNVPLICGGHTHGLAHGAVE